MNAILIVNDPQLAAGMTGLLRRRGFSVAVTDDTEQVLRDCREHSPDIVVVENRLHGMTGIRFLSELIRISWTTSAILIAEEDPELIHEQTEGLGILGSVTSLEDREGMEKLLNDFFKIRTADRSATTTAT